MATIILLAMIIIWLAMFVGLFAGMYKVYEKAGAKPWAVFVPFYNSWIMVKIVDRPWYWFAMFFIPFVGIVMILRVTFDLGKCFGKSTGFIMGLIFLPFIFYPILGFSDAAFAKRQA